LHKDLAERPIFDLLVSELSSPSPTPWEHVGNTLLASRMNPPQDDEHLERWKRAVAAYAPGPARPMLEAGQPRLTCIDDGELNPWVSFFSVLDGTRALVLAVLDDREENLAEPAFRDTWIGFLRLYHFLRYQPNAWFISRSWLDKKDYTPLVQLRSGPGETPWGDIEEVLPEFNPLCEALMDAGIPPPDIGLDIPSQSGRTWTDAELVWESDRVAVTDRRRVQEAEGTVAEGWQVFVLEDLDGEDLDGGGFGGPEAVIHALRRNREGS
jgi:hypothetical protein